MTELAARRLTRIRRVGRMTEHAPGTNTMVEGTRDA
jgi:hypothetical protein